MKEHGIQSVTDTCHFCCYYFWKHTLFFESPSYSWTLLLKFYHDSEVYEPAWPAYSA